MPGRHSQLEPARGIEQGAGLGHGHGHGPPPDLHVGALPRTVLLGFLALALAATVVGLVVLFPSGGTARPSADYAAPGVTFPHAKVTEVSPRCPGPDPEEQCAQMEVRLTDGVGKGSRATVQVPPEVAVSGLRAGDSVALMRLPAGAGAPAAYTFFGVDRDLPLGLMTLAFVVVVAAVARVKGLLALVGLVVSGLVVGKFMLPALLAGSSGLQVALVGSSAIMFVVLYLAHGVSLRTSAALAGTLVGVAVTAGLAASSVGWARLSGVGDDATGLLGAQVHALNFQGLLTCAIIVAALGVLNDVTITQAAAVWELRSAAPDMSRRALFASGMRIGRDHIASTIYTIVFAYAGAALAVLLLLNLYDRPLLELLGSENLAEEIVRTLAGGIGLVLAVPITTAIASLVVASPRPVD